MSYRSAPRLRSWWNDPPALFEDWPRGACCPAFHRQGSRGAGYLPRSHSRFAPAGFNAGIINERLLQFVESARPGKLNDAIDNRSAPL